VKMPLLRKVRIIWRRREGLALLAAAKEAVVCGPED